MVDVEAACGEHNTCARNAGLLPGSNHDRVGRLLGRDAIPGAERGGVGKIGIAFKGFVIDAEERETRANLRLDSGCVVSQHRVRMADP
jgi:hypothetical protein